MNHANLGPDIVIALSKLRLSFLLQTRIIVDGWLTQSDERGADILSSVSLFIAIRENAGFQQPE